MNKIKFSFSTEWFSLLCLLVVIVASYLAYPHLPVMVPSHWNIAGQIDGYMPRLTHTFAFPGMMLAMYLLFIFFPSFEPRREHFLRSMGFYQIIRNFLMIFFTVIYGFTIAAALGYHPAINVIVPVMVGILFIILGNYMPQIKSNFFMGIRTPWALSSEENWYKTHKMGGICFALSGLLFLASPFLPAPFNFWLPMAGILVASLVPYAYSYWLFTNKK